MIVNRAASPYLFDHRQVQIRKHSTLTRILDLDESVNYWYVEFLSGSSLKILKDVIPLTVLTKLQNGSLNLILANIHEAFHSVVESIYEIAVKNLNIPEESILLVSESADVHKEIARVAQLNNKKQIKAKWARIFEFDIHQYSKLKPCKNVTLEEKIYEKKFLNFNRRWRVHRPLFVSLLLIKNLLEKGFVSMAPSDDGHNWGSVFPAIMLYNSPPYNTAYPELPKMLEENKDKILSLPPMYLDTKELEINQAHLANSTDIFYRNSYFSVVSETNFYTTIGDFEPGRFLSEKAFKPVFNRHPFLILSPPHTLDLIRSLGYKTFSPFINESYDIEPNDFKRMLMIVEEVERLSNLSEIELKIFLDNVRPICEYNYNHLTNKNPAKDFSTWLIK